MNESLLKELDYWIKNPCDGLERERDIQLITSHLTIKGPQVLEDIMSTVQKTFVFIVPHTQNVDLVVQYKGIKFFVENISNKWFAFQVVNNRQEPVENSGGKRFYLYHTGGQSFQDKFSFTHSPEFFVLPQLYELKRSHPFPYNSMGLMDNFGYEAVNEVYMKDAKKKLAEEGLSLMLIEVTRDQLINDKHYRWSKE